MDIDLLGFAGIVQMPNVHPLFVHFPIALAPVACLLHAMGLWRKDDGFLRAARTVLWLATLGAAAAVLAGLHAARTVPHDETIHHLMETHEILGYSILAALLLALVLGRMDSGRKLVGWGLTALLAAASLLAFQNADLGGRMVYVHGAGVKAAASPARIEDGGQTPATPTMKPQRHVHGQGGSQHHH